MKYVTRMAAIIAAGWILSTQAGYFKQYSL